MHYLNIRHEPHNKPSTIVIPFLSGGTEAQNRETYCWSKAPNHFRFELTDRSRRIPRVGDTEPRSREPSPRSSWVSASNLAPPVRKTLGSHLPPPARRAEAGAVQDRVPEGPPPGGEGTRPTSPPIRRRELGVPLPVGLNLGQ